MVSLSKPPAKVMKNDESLRVMIDILHPAHVHFFRCFHAEMVSRGHQVLVTSRQKDCTTALLEEFRIPHRCLSHSTRTPHGQAFELMTRTARFVREARRFRPNALTGIMGPTIALAGKVLRCPSYVFYDTEFAKVTNRFVDPMATRVIHPNCYQHQPRKNEIRYAGLHELAYLHPNRFTPSRDVVRRGGVDPDQPYIVVRFVGFWASHDRSERGLSPEKKCQLVQRLERFGRVVITSEASVPEAIADRVYEGPRSELHHLLAFAALYYGESATIASESAVLGTPGVYIATSGRGYLDELSRHGLLSQFTDDQFEESLEAAESLLEDIPGTQARTTCQRDDMLDEMIDVTEFMVDLFETQVKR